MSRRLRNRATVSSIEASPGSYILPISLKILASPDKQSRKGTIAIKGVFDNFMGPSVPLPPSVPHTARGRRFPLWGSVPLTGLL